MCKGNVDPAWPDGGTQPEGALPADSWLRALEKGSRVWWNDPDAGCSSGYYTVAGFGGDRIEFADAVVVLKSETGSEAEVCAADLARSKPDNLCPVVDGDAGHVDVYGFATSAEEALAVARAHFADEVNDVCLAENVRLPDGTTASRAWVAVTVARPEQETAHLRLLLEVRYALKGTTTEDMATRLQRMAERAMAEGQLTGETAAEIDGCTFDVAVVPPFPTETELSVFMRERIESRALALEDIPVHLARYGLMDPVNFVGEMTERMELTKSSG